MQLLAPLFLLGLALAAIPFWLHRLKTETPKRETFASSMFLKASEDPVHVRSKLRYLALMAMRILFLLLLALVFAQPFLPRETALPETEVSNYHLIVVDTSASMNSDGKLAQARRVVDGILDDLGADEAAQLFSLDEVLRQHSSMDTDASVVLAGFDEIALSVSPLSYGYLARTVESIMSAQEGAGQHYQIHFISDYQQSAMPSRFADLVPEPTAAVSYDLSNYDINQSADNAINLAIDQVFVVGQEVRVSVRSHTKGGLNTSADSLSFEVRARIGQGDWRSAEDSVDPAGRITVGIDGFDFDPVQNQVAVELIADDELAVDNQYFFIENRSTPEPLLLLTDNPSGSSALYISALFAEQVSESTGRNFSAEIQSLGEFDPRTLSRYSWVLIDDIGSVSSGLGDNIADFISDGGAVFAASASNTDSIQALPISNLPLASDDAQETLLGSQPLFKTVTSVDQGHPVMNGLTGWSDLRFERWLEIDDTQDAQVLVELEGGVPLLIEQSIGRGKLMLLTSGLDNQWNNLPVKPLFVAMMRSTAQYLSGAELIEPYAFAGDSLTIKGDGNSAGQLIDPDGNAVLTLGDNLQSGRLKMNKTGFYQAYTASGEYSIGVNLHPAESELVSVSQNSLEEWQQLATRSIDSSAVSATLIRANESDDYSVKLWFWLLVIAALAVLIESLLANRYLSNNTRVIQSGPVR